MRWWHERLGEHERRGDKKNSTVNKCADVMKVKLIDAAGRTAFADRGSCEIPGLNKQSQS